MALFNNENKSKYHLNLTDDHLTELLRTIVK